MRRERGKKAKNRGFSKKKEHGRKEEERQDFSLSEESDLLHQRRREHGTTIPPPATFIITLSIKHDCRLHWRRGEEEGGKAEDLGKEEEAEKVMERR